jgi:hypothetical protein
MRQLVKLAVDKPLNVTLHVVCREGDKRSVFERLHEYLTGLTGEQEV